MIFTVLPVSFAMETGKYVVIKDIAVVYASPAVTSEKLAEVTFNTVLDITEIRSNGFGYVTLSKDGVNGWIQMSYLEALAAPEVSTDVTGIFLNSLPTKLTYTDGIEELDLTGLSVYARKKDGSSYPVSDYRVYAPEMKVPGEKSITVTYSPDKVNTFSAFFTVSVIRVPVTKISVVTLPQTEYLEHGKLDLGKLSVTTEFSNPLMNETLTFAEMANNPDYSITGCHGETHGDALEKGRHTFTVMYKYPDITCSFTVDVTPRKLTGLNLIKEPDILTVYDNTKIPALDGLILEAVYDNGEKEEIPHYLCEAVCDPSEFIIGPDNEVKVYFGDLFVTLSFVYLDAPAEQGIKLKIPLVLTFYKGEIIDMSELKVYLYYTDNSFIEVTDYEITGINYSMMGSQNIAVKYKDYSEVFTIYITPYFSKGDIDGDGDITSGDARQALRASVGLTTLAGMTFFAGDADRDGSISAADARLILRASVKLENLYITL